LLTLLTYQDIREIVMVLNAADVRWGKDALGYRLMSSPESDPNGAAIADCMDLGKFSSAQLLAH
jgi:hypothetical protein